MGLKDESKELNILLAEVKLKNVPLLIFANDRGLVQALPTDEVNSLKLNKITDRQWSICPCSAETLERLQEGMEWFIKTVQDK
ncbi:unnamed protein product [Paramecium octaurelia]|uniref:Uncharacterized protein n=1 Tax=Paramecium octaurelia TaxID=43137 RepID=A0A8S1YSI1_PAROT|nr:unnamed protein product [Paramecium octaurelia]